jgi:hypothetical protein
MKVQIFCIILLFLIFSSIPVFTQSVVKGTSPNPKSALIDSVIWHWNTHITSGAGSDQWPVTWADDDHLYLCWGDGGGFGGSRVSMGVARIDGIPPSWNGINVWGGGNALSSQPAILGKARISCVDNIIYLWAVKQGSWDSTRIVKSSDHGLNWNVGPFILERPIHSFNPIQYGKNYAGGPAGYVYGIFADGDGERICLGRVPRSGIENRNAYEVFSGLDGSNQPTWSTNVANRQPIFTDALNGVNWGYQAVYHPVFKRYLLTVTYGGTNEGPGLGIYEAFNPWGPYYTVAIYDQWKDNLNKFCFSFPQKWMEANGLNGWMIHSGWPEYDSYNHIKYTFVLKVQDNTPPTAPSNLNATAISNSQISLAWSPATDSESGISFYNIYRGGVNVGTASDTFFTDQGLNENTTYVYEISAANLGSLEGPKCAPDSATTLADTIRPTIVSITAELNKVTVVFSEPVELASVEDVSNYSIDKGISVSLASLQADLVTMVLTTSAHAEDTTYTLSVNNIKDRATVPNTIDANTQKTYQFQASLIAHWTFEENSGDTAIDSSGNGHHGRLMNGAVRASGKIGQAIELDGSDDHINVANTQKLQLTTEFTITAWIFPTGWGGNNQGRIVDKEGSGYLFQVMNNSSFTLSGLGVQGTTPVVWSNANVVTLNTWQHVSVIYGAGELFF